MRYELQMERYDYKEIKDFYKQIINKNLENIVLEKTIP